MSGAEEASLSMFNLRSYLFSRVGRGGEGRGGEGEGVILVEQQPGTVRLAFIMALKQLPCSVGR